MSFSFSLEVLDLNRHLEDISLRSRIAGFFGKKDSFPSSALGSLSAFCIHSKHASELLIHVALHVGFFYKNI